MRTTLGKIIILVACIGNAPMFCLRERLVLLLDEHAIKIKSVFLMPSPIQCILTWNQFILALDWSSINAYSGYIPQHTIKVLAPPLGIGPSYLVLQTSAM